MPLAIADREIEAELGWLDTNLRGQTLCANLIEQPEIMIADGGGFARVRYRFPELSVEQTATSSGDGRACLQGVFRTFTRHELPGSAFNERAVESEVVETFTSRCSEENRATEGQLLELFENLFRFFRVVAGDRQLDQIVGESGDVKRLEIDSLIAKPAGDTGEHTRLVLEQHEVDFALSEADVGSLQRAAGDHDVVGQNARHRCGVDSNCCKGPDVNAASTECLRHSREIAWVIGELDRAISHRGLLET